MWPLIPTLHDIHETAGGPPPGAAVSGLLSSFPSRSKRIVGFNHVIWSHSPRFQLDLESCSGVYLLVGPVPAAATNSAR